MAEEAEHGLVVAPSKYEKGGEYLCCPTIQEFKLSILYHNSPAASSRAISSRKCRFCSRLLRMMSLNC